MRKNILILGVLLISTFLVMGSANASLIIDHGVPITLIDSNDGDTTVTVANFNFTDYDFGYMDGGFNPLPVFPLSATFEGGTVLDLALYDGSSYYTIASMVFLNEINNPSVWPSDYYKSVNITWESAGGTLTTEIAGSTTNIDGIAPLPPTPEPATLLLLGSGIAGLVVAARKRKGGHKKL